MEKELKKGTTEKCISGSKNTRKPKRHSYGYYLTIGFLIGVCFASLIWGAVAIMTNLFGNADEISLAEESVEDELEDVATTNVITNGNGINILSNVVLTDDQKTGFFSYLEEIIEQANKRLVQINEKEMELQNYDISYDGTTVTIRSNQSYEKYQIQHKIVTEKEYVIQYLARIIDLEAGSGKKSSFEEKVTTGEVFIIRVDTQYNTFDGVYYDENQYGSSASFSWAIAPSAEALSAAEYVYSEYEEGTLDCPDWLWCQGMLIWGEIYQISFQYPEIEGQSPQYFTAGFPKN